MDGRTNVKASVTASLILKIEKFSYEWELPLRIRSPRHSVAR